MCNEQCTFHISNCILYTESITQHYMQINHPGRNFPDISFGYCALSVQQIYFISPDCTHKEKIISNTFIKIAQTNFILSLITLIPFFHKNIKDIIQSLNYTFIYRNCFIKKLHTSFPHKVHTKYQTIEYSCSMSTPHPLKYQSLISFVVS